MIRETRVHPFVSFYSEYYSNKLTDRWDMLMIFFFVGYGYDK